MRILKEESREFKKLERPEDRNEFKFLKSNNDNKRSNDLE